MLFNFQNKSRTKIAINFLQLKKKIKKSKNFPKNIFIKIFVLQLFK